MTTSSGPDSADWLAALLRGLHPLRYLLCLVGLVLTGLSAAAAKSFFDPGPPDLQGWWDEPLEHAQALGAEILDGSVGRIIVRGGPLLALNAALWFWIGGWIARHELMVRRRGQSDTADGSAAPGATMFLIGWWKSLATSPLGPLLIAILLLLPVLFARTVNEWFGSVGAVVVSGLLPVVLVADLVLLAVVVGVVAWPLMPVAVAAECSDQFDAISRSYSYFYQCPIRYLLLTATALGLAGLPLGVLYALAETGQTVFFLAAALSASIFWSLETLVYLHLRAVVDDVDAGAVAVGPAPTTPATPAPEDKSAEVLASGGSSRFGRSGVTGAILMLAGMVGSWCLTFWLFSRAGGGQTAWLGWGLGETFVPPAEGGYRVASVIAGIWALAWLGLPLLWAGRRLFSGGPPRDSSGHEAG